MIEYNRKLQFKQTLICMLFVLDFIIIIFAKIIFKCGFFINYIFVSSYMNIFELICAELQMYFLFNRFYHDTRALLE